MKRRICRNAYGNWYGYDGGRKVMTFGEGTFFTAEDTARAWRDGTPCSSELCAGYWSEATEGLCTRCCAAHGEPCDICHTVGYHDAECATQTGVYYPIARDVQEWADKRERLLSAGIKIQYSDGAVEERREEEEGEEWDVTRTPGGIVTAVAVERGAR